MVTCFAASLAGAQSTNSIPRMPVDPKTQQVQNQAEEVYQRSNYERAFGIYLKDLAPIGDKYAQYMVGFMYLTGKGVAEDRVTASAWYRLSAERGTKEFIRARDQLMASLDAEQTAESDRKFIEVRKQYGDLALLIRLIRKDHRELRSRTGTRVGAGTSPLSVVDMNRNGVSTSGEEFYDRIERRMNARIEYILKYSEVGIIDLDMDNVDIDEIERQVESHLNQLD